MAGHDVKERGPGHVGGRLRRAAHPLALSMLIGPAARAVEPTVSRVSLG
jgi:hypothetical protein